MNWSQEMIINLIEAYQNKPELWDNSLKEYSDRSKRRDAWQDIAALINVDIPMAEKKMKSLRTHFMAVHKEYMRIKYLSEDARKPKWFAYDLLTFLVKGMELRMSQDSFIQELAFESEDIEDMVPGPGDQEYICKQEPPIRSFSNTPPISPKPVEKRVKPMQSTLVNEAYEVVKKMTDERTSRDEFTVFGEHVAIKLRNIKNAKTRLQTEQKIMNLLFDAEMTNFD